MTIKIKVIEKDRNEEKEIEIPKSFTKHEISKKIADNFKFTPKDNVKKNESFSYDHYINKRRHSKYTNILNHHDDDEKIFIYSTGNISYWDENKVHKIQNAKIIVSYKKENKEWDVEFLCETIYSENEEDKN
jgi:hypothetical protein